MHGECYAVVDNQKHFDYIVDHLVSQGYRPFKTKYDRMLRSRDGNDKIVIYYGKGALSYGTLDRAERNGDERKDITMYCLPKELFQL